MSLFSFIYLLLIAVAFTFIFYYLFRIRGPWGSYWTFFTVLFLGIWAAYFWISPFGPYWRDIYWFPPVIVGFIIAVLLAAAAPSPKARAVMEKERQQNIPESTARVVAGTFFWIFLAVLVAIILAGLL